MNSMKVQRFFRGLSQEQLAQLIGIDQGALSKVETGKAKQTSRTRRIQKAISGVLGVSVDSLFPDPADSTEKKPKS